MGLPLSVPLISNAAVKYVAKEESVSLSSWIGKGLLLGAGAASMGAIIYCRTLGPGNGIIDTMEFHEDHVLARGKQTLCYWAGSLGIASISCAILSHAPLFSDSLQEHSFMSVFTTTIASLFSGVWLQGIPYRSYALKHAAWVLHCAVIGAIMSPIVSLSCLVLLKSAGWTLLIVGELTCVAFCTHHMQFLSLGILIPISTLSLMLGTVAAYMWPNSSWLLGFILYGGFIIISMHILFDAQVLASYAVWCNRNGALFDPLNAATDLFLDTVKLFLRITAFIYVMNIYASESVVPKSG